MFKYIFKYTRNDLIKNGFKIVIYATSYLEVYPAMVNTASILINKKSKNIENKISSVKDIINLIS